MPDGGKGWPRAKGCVAQVVLRVQKGCSAMPYWFDPISFLLVLSGSVGITILRCGWGEARDAVRTAFSLLRPPFDRAEAKAEMAKQVREIADDGFVRAEAHHIGDGEFDNLTDLLISRRSVDALFEEHELYKSDRADKAARAGRVFDVAAEAGPIMGLAGTLIALASQRAGGSADLVAAVGMAVLTTLYGLLIANVVFAPVANAIARRNETEERDREAVLAWLGDGMKRITAQMIDDRPIGARSQS